MAKLSVPVIIEGVTGRMGRIALSALQQISRQNVVQVDGDTVDPVPIGVDLDAEKVRRLQRETGLKRATVELAEAVDLACRTNPRRQVYQNTVATGYRKETVLRALGLLDAKTTAIFLEKPLASNYADGFEIVRALEGRGFVHGVVHQMLEAPGIRRAIELMPEIKPLSAQMTFGYEVGSGFGENEDYFAQRPDFNWRFRDAGGGIILDMSHESYLSEALFGPTERLSAIARLLVPKRLSADGKTVIDCDVEDFAALRRQHTSGVVNSSVWSWYRRINSEFGPLEITVDGENGSIVFGLYGLKVQWRETAPAVRWQRSVFGEGRNPRDYWQYEKLPLRNPFVAEWCNFLKCAVRGENYPLDAIHALNILGQVEAFYQSAAGDGQPVRGQDVLRYPQRPPASWRPERLQGKLRRAEN